MTDETSTSETESSSIDRATSIDIPAPVEFMVELLIPTVADTVDVRVDFIHQHHVVVHIYDETQTAIDGEGGPVFSIALPTSPDESVELVRTPSWENDEWYAARREEETREAGPDLETE